MDYPETSGLTSLRQLTSDVKDHNRLVLTVAELHAYVDADRAQRAAPGVQGGEVNAYTLLARVLEAYEGIPINMRTRGDTGIPFMPEVAKALVVLEEGLRQATAQQTPPAAVDAGSMKVGGRYNWKNQPERLIYMGKNWSGNGYWHQFSRTQLPDVVWCEVLDSDLPMFEETKDTK